MEHSRLDHTILLTSPAASEAIFASELNRPGASPRKYCKERAVANLYDMLDATPTTRQEILSSSTLAKVRTDEVKVTRKGLSTRPPNMQLVSETDTPKNLTKKFSSLAELLDQSPRTRVADRENDINTMEVSMLVEDTKPEVKNFTPMRMIVSNNGRTKLDAKKNSEQSDGRTL